MVVQQQGKNTGEKWKSLKRERGFFGDNENVLKLTVEMVGQFCEYNKIH